MKSLALILITLLAGLIAACPAAAAGGAPRAKDDASDTVEGKIAVEGGNVWYKIVGRSKKGIPLLVVHGGPGAPHDMLEPLEALADERPVVFYDQLGCGNSDRPSDRSLWTVERFVRELAAVRRELKLEKMHILGQSWGTMLAVNYMLSEKPSGVGRLVFSGPYLSSKLFEIDCRKCVEKLSPESKDAIERCEKTNKFDGADYKKATMEFYKKHVCNLSEWPDCLNRAFDKMGVDVYTYMWGPSEFSATGTLKDLDVTGRLGEIDRPVLFTVGGSDEIAIDTVKFYQSKIKDSKMVVFEGGTHCHHLEFREKYVDTVREFLKGE